MSRSIMDTDYVIVGRHRNMAVTDAQISEHEYREGHIKYGRGKHEAFCHCDVSEMSGAHTYSHHGIGGPYGCTIFVPSR